MPTSFNRHTKLLQPKWPVPYVKPRNYYHPSIETKVNICTRCGYARFNTELQVHVTSHCFKYVCSTCEPFDTEQPMSERDWVKLTFDTYGKIGLKPKSNVDFTVLFGVVGGRFLTQPRTSFTTEYYKRLHVMNGVRVLSSEHEADCERPLGKKFNWGRVPDWQDWFPEERPDWKPCI